MLYFFVIFTSSVITIGIHLEGLKTREKLNFLNHLNFTSSVQQNAEQGNNIQRYFLSVRLYVKYEIK